MAEIILGNTTVGYTVKRSARATKIRLNINSREGLVVTIPATFPLGDVPSILLGRGDWIVKHYARAMSEVKKVPRFTFAAGEALDFLGEKLAIAVQVEKMNGMNCVRKQDTIVIRISDEIAEQNRSAHVKAIILLWMKRQAQFHIPRRVIQLSGVMNVHPRAVKIRDQKSKWGNCSGKGNLNFNQRLMMAPSDVIDYLIVHELAHLREQNHSPAFYALVEKFCPEYKRYERWLKENGERILHL